MTDATPALNPDSLIRHEYVGASLEISDLTAHPAALFGRWLQDALTAQIFEPNTMILSTVGADLQPSGRAVLLKDYDEDGLVFYTNTDSRKAQEIATNPKVCLTLVWDVLHRQVRWEGRALPVTDDEADAYFRSRPPGARIAAAASPQSQPIADREWLAQKVSQLWDRYPTGEVPRPHYWGGFRVVPETVEFWQGREHRLHDRFRYQKKGAGWEISRLAP